MCQYLLGMLQMMQQSILPSVMDEGECCKMLYLGTLTMNGKVSTFREVQYFLLAFNNVFQFFEISHTNSINGEAYPVS